MHPPISIQHFTWSFWLRPCVHFLHSAYHLNEGTCCSSEVTTQLVHLLSNPEDKVCKLHIIYSFRERILKPTWKLSPHFHACRLKKVSSPSKQHLFISLNHSVRIRLHSHTFSFGCSNVWCYISFSKARTCLPSHHHTISWENSEPWRAAMLKLSWFWSTSFTRGCQINIYIWCWRWLVSLYTFFFISALFLFRLLGLI